MKISNYKTKIKNKIWTIIRDHFYFNRIIDSKVVQNINYNGSNIQRRVLISYSAEGYFINLETNIGRTVLNEIFKIINVFSEMGYSIDIIDCNDVNTIKIVSGKKYEIIFGFGENFYKATNINPKAISILYMTENHPFFSFQEEKKRLDYFNMRHGKHIEMQRSGKYYKLHHLDKKYSQVIALGEIELLKNQYKDPYSIFPTGIINTQFNYTIKNHQLTRKNFLWLGSSGAIHKGLDLLIDIFKSRDDITLHICGFTKQDKKLLDIPQRKNIIEYGHINIKSGIFLNIVNTCTYIILPSCSEGCATSILTGMLHGLVPIVMKNAGFNKLEDNVFFLNDYRIEYIDNQLSELANATSEELNVFSKKVFDFARENFIISEFEMNFRKIILDIIKK